jgi:UDP-N-acetylmuramyl pentapeptide phosphotransferase/UDP-N-acetylglucosamine-1-phosphate transferase
MDWVWMGAVFVTTFGLAVAMRQMLTVPPLVRVNYAGREVPTAGGIVAVLALVTVAAVAATVDSPRFGLLSPVVELVLGFAILGLLDDVVGNHAARGLRGHLGALRRGQVTSGLLKLVVGFAVAWSVTEFFGDNWNRLLCAVVIAGCANVANLLDLAPARTFKVAALTTLLLAALGERFAPTYGIYWFVVAAAALVPFELSETLMLGDTGANPLGATVGFAVVFELSESRAALAAAAAVVIALNVAAEFVSFSRIIERVPPLRLLDELGRRR